MSAMSYEEFKSELQERAVAIDETSKNLAAANKEYERTKAEFFEKQDTATPQERYDLGQDMHAARKEADSCRAGQASALEAFSELVQAHPEYANRASEDLGEAENHAQTRAPESNSFQEAMTSAWQSLSEAAGKVTDAVTGNVAKHLFAVVMVTVAAGAESAGLNHEIREDLEAHRAGVERQLTQAEKAQQSPPGQAHSGAAAAAGPEQGTGSQHHHPSHHEHDVWPKLQPDILEDEEAGVVNEPPVNDNTDWHRVAANDNTPRPPDSPQAARALPPQAVNESPQAVGRPVHVELVAPPPPPPPPPEPEADRTRSR